VCARNGSRVLTMPKLSNAIDRVDLINGSALSVDAVVRFLYCLTAAMLYKDWMGWMPRCRSIAKNPIRSPEVYSIKSAGFRK